MGWIKKGLIYKPDGSQAWSQSHAQVPIAHFNEKEDCIKVFYSTRDKEGISRPGYVILDANDPKKILEIGSKPILDIGKLGTFDDCGVMPSWILDHPNGEQWLYYIGWNVRNTISYHNSVGLAISRDHGKTFKKFSDGPLWDRNHIEPHYSGTSCVILENGIFKNWYLSCTEWRIVNNKPEPRYHIKYAESNDGINWERKGNVAIDYADDHEAGIVKASVILESGRYRMWYSYRKFGDYRVDKAFSYRIGYAESIDGINWKRMDGDKAQTLSISNESTEWDSLMVEYPHVIDVKNKRLMFYNGNTFGKSGFGYSEYEP